MHKLLHFKSHENCQVVSGITADDKKKKKKICPCFCGLALSQWHMVAFPVASLTCRCDEVPREWQRNWWHRDLGEDQHPWSEHWAGAEHPTRILEAQGCSEQ